MYRKKDILAFSKGLEMEVLRDNIVRVTGPGWFFFQPESIQIQANNKTALTGTLLSLVLIMLLF